MRVANRHGERVCGVIRLGDRIQAEEHFHHLLNLHFFGAPIADYRLLAKPGMRGYAITSVEQAAKSSEAGGEDRHQGEREEAQRRDQRG